MLWMTSIPKPWAAGNVSLSVKCPAFWADTTRWLYPNERGPMKSAQKSVWLVAAVLVLAGLASLTAGIRAGDGAAPALRAAAAPQIRMYLWVEGIPGEIPDGPHQGWMEVQAYEHEPNLWQDPDMTKGGPTGDLQAFRLTVTRSVGAATPALLLSYCRQTLIPKVTLEVWREGGDTPQKVMVYTGHDAAMNAIRNLKSLTADGTPTEELTFLCSAMEWAYMEYDASGKPMGEIRTQWDSRTGR